MSRPSSIDCRARTLRSRWIGKELQINLDRTADFGARAPESCRAVVADFAAKIAEMLVQEDRPPTIGALRAVARTTEQVQAMADEPREPLGQLVAAPLVAGLWLVCVVDRSASASVLWSHDLPGLGISRADALNAATRNIASNLPPLHEVVWSPRDSGVTWLDGDGYYESSRLLLHDDWAVVHRRMRGDLLVTAPHSRLMIFGDGDEPGVLEEMRSPARREAAVADRPIAMTILRWRSSGREVHVK